MLTESEDLKSYIPTEFGILAEIKALYFGGLADMYVGLEQLDVASNNKDSLSNISRSSLWTGCARLLKAERDFVNAHKKCKSDTYMCSILIEKIEIVKKRLEEAGDFIKSISKEDIANLMPCTGSVILSAKPNVSLLRVQLENHLDPFDDLGPLEVFNPKVEGFGFKVFGDRPVIVKDVVESGAAKRAGMQDGDVILSVCGKNIRTSSHGKLIYEKKELVLELTRLTVSSLNYKNQETSADSLFDWSTRATSFRTGRIESDDKTNLWDQDTIIGHDFAEKLGLIQ
eukprot:UC4_evm1s1416